MTVASAKYKSFSLSLAQTISVSLTVALLITKSIVNDNAEEKWRLYTILPYASNNLKPFSVSSLWDFTDDISSPIFRGDLLFQNYSVQPAHIIHHHFLFSF